MQHKRVLAIVLLALWCVMLPTGAAEQVAGTEAAAASEDFFAPDFSGIIWGSTPEELTGPWLAPIAEEADPETEDFALIFEEPLLDCAAQASFVFGEEGLYAVQALLFAPEDGAPSAEAIEDAFTAAYGEATAEEDEELLFWVTETSLIALTFSLDDPDILAHIEYISLQALSEEQEALLGEGEAPTVYVGETGTKYHEESCSTLRGGAYPIALDDALAEGREPCKRCNPRV